MTPRLLPLSAVADDHERLDGRTVTGPVRVSVIVRTRDRLELLGEALAALGAQSWRPLEVVVVNDGGAPVDPVLVALPDDVSIVHRRLETAVGRSPAANLGLQLATGDWVAFCDDDDVWLPDGIATLVEAASTGGDAVVYGRVGAFHYAGEGAPRRRFRTFGRTFDPDVLLFENFIPIIGCLAPAAGVRAAGGVDESLECFEDWDLFLRLSDRLPFRFVDAEVAEYRVYGGGFITGAGGQERQDKGRAVLYAKHWRRFTPEVLSRVQHAVKADLLPREVAHELEGWRERVADLEAGVAERERGIEFLRGQLADAEARVTAAERAMDDAEARCIDVSSMLRRVEAADPARSTSVSVVLVNYNGRHHLERCLPALAATRDVPVETIVVDNGSNDNSLEWLAVNHPGVRVLAMGANLGFGAANQRGIEAASSEYVALLNTDTMVEPGWLRALLATLMADPGIGAACSTLRLLGHPGVLNASGGGMTKLGFGFDQEFGQPAGGDTPVLAECLFPTAAAMLMRRRDFEAVGGFDPEFFMYHEDVDLGWRLWLEGLRVVVVGDSIVHHAHGGTLKRERSLEWRERLGARHNVRSLLKHYEFWSMVRAARGLLRLWRHQRAYGLACHVAVWNAVHLPSTLRARRHVQRRRRISDRELFTRGLIQIAPYPPPTPELPRADEMTLPERWFVSHVLLPGYHSALGRLGYGWYPPEPIDGGIARAAAPRARCFLRTASGARGRVEVTLHRPEVARSGRPVTLRCNGRKVVSEQPVASFWERVQVESVADDRGVLTVDLESPPWVPHDLFGNWDFRTLGFAVRDVRFVPSESRTSPLSSVSVVIPTFNRREVLLKTLEALSEQTLADFEVVIVDDGSSDGSVAAVRAWAERREPPFRLVVVEQPNAGPGAARNRGVAEASGDLVVFLGDDTVPSHDFLVRHLSRHGELEGPCAVVGFTDWDRERMRVTPVLERINEEGQQFGYRHMVDGHDVPYTCFYTSNLSFERSILLEEPFNEGFAHASWEDVELGYRLSLRGVRVVYDRSATVAHYHPYDLTRFLVRQTRVGGTLGRLLELHPELANDPFLPPTRPSRSVRLVGRLSRLIAPICDRLDRYGVKLPTRLVDELMLAAFFRGKRQSAG